MHLEELLTTLADRLDAVSGRDLPSDSDAPRRQGSRWIGPGASPQLAARIAAGESVQTIDAPGPSRGDRPGLARAMKALAEATGSAGGFLVPPETAAEVLRLLRARSAVLRMGVRTVHVEKELDLTSLASGASAAYVAENARSPVSEQTFAQGPLLRPKELSALVPVSNRLLRDADANPSVETIVREDLAEVLALRADLAFLRGLGTAEEPRGIVNTPGLTPAPALGANGRTPTFDDLKAMVAALRAQNAPFAAPGWIFNPRLLQTLETVKDTTGRYLADAGLLTFDPTGGGGTLLGYPFRTTTQLPTNLATGSSTDTTEVVFGSDWNEAWVGENHEFELAVSGEAAYSTNGETWSSAFQQRQHLFRATWTHDFALRRPQLFSVMTGVRP